MINELNLKTGYESFLSVHALHRLVTHRLLQVSLAEELGVDQLSRVLSIDPVLGLVTEVSAGHEETRDQVVVLSVAGLHATTDHALHVLQCSQVVSQVSGQDIVSDQVQTPGVVSLAKVLQDVAALGVEDAHGLSEVVSLHDTALAAVQTRQHTVAADLITVVGAPVVQIMTHGGDDESK